MSNKLSAAVVRTITGLALATLFWTLYLYGPPVAVSGLFIVALAGILILEWPRLVPFKGIPGILFTLLYPIAPVVCLILLNQDPEHRELLALIYIMAPSFDTGSYFIGTMWGKHKLCPVVSPHKSWQGFIGGCIASWLGLVWFSSGTHISWIQTIILTLLIAPLALLGDLFESWLKRRASVKDSGFLLPGHGGLLDRLDSALFISVFCYLLRGPLVRLLS